MIYLLGGAPRIGKSIIARALAEQTGALIRSTDALSEAAADALPPEERAQRFPLPMFSGDPRENQLAPEERVVLQVRSAQSLEPDLADAIDRALATDQELVLEGIHLLPSFIRTMLDEHRPDRIRACIVGWEHVDRILAGMALNSDPGNWLRDAHSDVRKQVAAFTTAFSAYVHIEALRYDIPYCERTDAFEQDVASICALLRAGR